MTPPIRSATLPVHVLAWSILLMACGTRTALKPPHHPDAATDAVPRDGVGPDLRPDVGPDLGPDLGPETRPEVAPDLPPDLFREVPSDRPPDLVIPIDRGPDRWGDLPPEIGPDLPFDRLVPVEVPVDRFPDLVFPVDRFPDIVIPIDRGPDRLGDLRREDLVPRTDLPPLLDGACADGATVPCTCANGMAGNHVCLPSHVYSECVCGTPELLRVRNGLIGTWTGTATTPWVSPYAVAFAFDSYTHYSAESIDGQYPALYYGTDDDSPDKRYDITDIEDNGDASGYLDLVWSASGGTPTREILSGVQLSADGRKLSFWFMHSGSYGPLKYDLQRATP